MKFAFFCLSPYDNSLFFQESNKVDKKTVRTTRQTKKAKVEENSKNIKDMFSRAARKGR